MDSHVAMREEELCLRLSTNTKTSINHVRQTLWTLDKKPKRFGKRLLFFSDATMAIENTFHASCLGALKALCYSLIS